MIGLCRKGLDYDGEAMWFRVERDTSRRLAALSCIIERETRRSRISSLRHGRSAEYGQGEGDTVCESERHKGTLLLCITDMRVISGYFFCRLWRAVRTRGVGGGSTREEEYIVVGVEIGMGFVEVGGVWSWGRVGRFAKVYKAFSSEVHAFRLVFSGWGVKSLSTYPMTVGLLEKKVIHGTSEPTMS
ncbi:hypothetical protein Tco_0854490 [Tanacetum coccineum]